MSAEIQTKTWYSAGILVNPENLLEVAVFDYCYDHERHPGVIQVKFPGGTMKRNADRNDNTPEDTLCREIEEEVFKNRVGKVLESRVIYEFTPKPDHTKYFYLVERFDGQFRQEDLFEEDQGKKEERVENRMPRTERMGPPRYVDIRELAKVIFPFHAPALKAYSEYVAVDSKHLDAALDTMNTIQERGF